MVLDRSDFQAPSMGENLSPMQPLDFIKRVLGMSFVLGVIVFALGVGRNSIAPRMNNIASSLTGGLISSGGSSGGPWEDA